MPAKRLAALALLLLATMQVASAAVSLQLGLLAVKEGKNGYEGVVIDTVLGFGPGGGRVLLRPEGMVDDSTVASTRLGFMLSTALAGKNYRLYDLTLDFRTDTPVGGPSASGFIASTILLLSLGYAPDTSKATMTGMLSPAGLVLDVAGVPEKVKAAEAKGYSLVLLPKPETSQKLVSSSSTKIVGVCSVLDAAEELAGAHLAPKASLPRLGVPDVFRRDALRFINYTLSLLPLLDNSTRGKVEKLVDRARHTLDEDAYTAASLAFTALLRAANYTATVHGFGKLEERLDITLKEALQEAASAIDSVRYRANGGLCYTWRLAALSAASYRLYLAEHVSSEAGPYWRTLALLRALSAHTWAKAADTLEGPLAPCDYLASTVNATLAYAETAYRYFISILNVPAVRVLTHLIDNRTMAEWLEDAKSALHTGNYPLALGLTVYVLSEIEFRMDAPNTVADCLSTQVAKLYSIAGDAFAVPALYYHQYAQSFLVNTTNASSKENTISVIQLESAALAWMLPAVFLHAVTAQGGTEALAAQALPAGSLTPYAIVAAEALLLGVVGVAAARATRNEV